MRSKARAVCNSLTFFLGPWPAPELFTRLRLLITSVLRLIGRARPCSLRKRPQALQRTDPISSRRHSGVVEVEQFWQVGCEVSRSLLAMVAMIMKRERGYREIRGENFGGLTIDKRLEIGYGGPLRALPYCASRSPPTRQPQTAVERDTMHLRRVKQ